mmetsp:Transcript_34766/g.102197  ORF Transcript_34766/g.102197 Transcript_34766/m.102197 type:complete len:228 (+) Transcript_34766:443-1126(+)|eukprot:CAMPEP_0181040792 /NCGR_PEP_ID=MMETSP1070-20121207/11245_1 /TAXON_ID=265543 /ORGANISM="Minutocellus polymorphus, Strain NH13" /LENGTH=227 /DNA_ID=CAMNT_0023118841 /DNA_START=138 /DNA_END=821 /DNA_ORIENTATION=+
MPGFDATITPEGLAAAEAAAEAAANNPEAFEFTQRAAAAGTSASSWRSLLDAPLEYAQTAYRAIIYYLRYTKYYLQTNAWSIVFMVAGFYVFKGYIFDPWYEEFKARRSYRQATDPSRVRSLESDMRRIRAAQQEEAARKSREAAEEAKKKKAEELETKRVKQPMESTGGCGQRLGGDGPARRRRPNNSGRPSSGPSRSGYNPLNPSANDGGGGYRAPRRDLNRRGG